MRRQAILLLAVMGVALVVVLASCGGGTNAPEKTESTTASGKPYNVDATMASLQEAGWGVTKVEEAQDTYTVPDIGYLEADAPDGEPIDMEFFASPEEAQAELDQTKVEEAPFEGTTIGNILVFDPENDTAAVSEENLQALQGLVR